MHYPSRPRKKTALFVTTSTTPVSSPSRPIGTCTALALWCNLALQQQNKQGEKKKGETARKPKNINKKLFYTIYTRGHPQNNREFTIKRQHKISSVNPDFHFHLICEMTLSGLAPIRSSLLMKAIQGTL